MALVPRASSGSELGRGDWLLSPGPSPKALGQLVLMHWILVAEKQWEEPLPAVDYVLGGGGAGWAVSTFIRAPGHLLGRTALASPIWP